MKKAEQLRWWQKGIFAYMRKSASKTFFVALNLGENKQCVRIDRPGSIILSTTGGRNDEHVDGKFSLSENEGVIVALQAN